MRRRTHQAALMAAGVLAAGMAPSAAPQLPERARTRKERVRELAEREAWGTLTDAARAELEFLRGRRDCPNGAQLSTWRAQAKHAAQVARAAADRAEHLRISTWGRHGRELERDTWRVTQRVAPSVGRRSPAAGKRDDYKKRRRAFREAHGPAAGRGAQAVLNERKVARRQEALHG